MTDAPHTPEPEDAEVVDGLPVLPEAEPESGSAGAVTFQQRIADVVLASPARQVATLAAGGFMAGAATAALVHRHNSKTVAKRLRSRRNGRPALGEIVTSNSFLVDVHLLRRD